MKFWLARHAQPLLAAGICYGASDVPADAELTLQSARALAAVLPGGVQVVSSPLQRCVQLAQALQVQRPDLPFVCDARLAEMSFGSWEGVPWAQIPKAAVDAWQADFAQHRFGGGESVDAFMQRVGAAWDDWQACAHGPGVLWISHAGVTRAAALLHHRVRRVRLAADWPVAGLACGGWAQLAPGALSSAGSWCR